MKARLLSVLLCIGAFVLSMFLMMNMIETPLRTTPQVGEGTGITDDDSDGDTDDGKSELVTDVSSVEGVKSVAKETVEFLETLAFGREKSLTFGGSFKNLLTKWENAAAFLQGAGDAAGAECYHTLAAVWREIQEKPFSDTAAFMARVPAFLARLSAATPQTTDGLYPVLDTDANGTVSLAMLAACRLQNIKTDRIHVTFGGNVAMGDLIGSNHYEKLYAKEGAQSPLAGVSAVLGTDDLSIVSLDNALTTSTSSTVAVTDAFRGKFTETYATMLAEAGVDVVSLATCHVNDFGEAGYADTKNALESAGITVAEDGKIAYFEAPAGKVAILSYNLTGQPNVRYTAVPQAQIAEAREAGAVLCIVYFHMGNPTNPDYNAAITAAMANTLRDAADNGADLVLCSHTNVIQGMLLRGDDPRTALCFSPGNLSYAESVDEGTSTDALLYAHSFVISAGTAIPSERTAFCLNNNSVGAGATFAPALYLDTANVTRIGAALTAMHPNFEGHLTEGDLDLVFLP